MRTAILRHGRGDPRRYSRLFPDLPPWRATDQDLDEIAATCFDGQSQDNPDLAAGYTYFGQFIVHDLTFDARPLGGEQDAEEPNQRTPRFDLDSLYAGGPLVTPAIYDVGSFGRFLLTHYPGNHVDIPRNVQGTGILGDSRNDENLIVSQIHSTFLKAHNRELTALKPAAGGMENAFLNAARRIRWRYQWAILTDFLPRLLGASQLGRLIDLDDRRRRYDYTPLLFRRDEPVQIPLEFSGGAMRFGHSMVRPSYRLRGALHSAPPLDISLFAATGPSLRGGQRCTPALAIDWCQFFDASNAPLAQRAQRIGPRLAAPLRHVPGPAPENLALRNLLRGLDYGLPSGQGIARLLGMTPIRAGRHDPLWYYILLEAQTEKAGKCLGSLGGAIVAGTIVDILVKDPDSVLNQPEAWSSELRNSTVAGFFPYDQPEARQSVIEQPDWQVFADMLRQAPKLDRIVLERAVA